jgi:hypothetical protein
MFVSNFCYNYQIKKHGRAWHVARMGRSATFLDLRGALNLSIPGLCLRQCFFVLYCISSSDYKELR